jgi:hypothetical protein
VTRYNILEEFEMAGRKSKTEFKKIVFAEGVFF